MMAESTSAPSSPPAGDLPLYVTPWILAADPTVRRSTDGPAKGPPVTTKVRIPRENWRAGPIGTRVQVVDYDTSTQKFYGRVRFDPDELAAEPSDTALATPDYQAQNLFATAMATIGQFERALGRRIGFATDTHQIKLAPHAFVGANAFYDRRSEAIMFGYFRGRDGNWVDTSLSYDVVVHEMTHAILDGLRPRFVDPSSPDQAAFHEAFADIVAILSTLTRRELVQWALEETVGNDRATLRQIGEALSKSFLLNIGPQLGQEMPQRRRALRHSFELTGTVEADPAGGTRIYRARRKKREPHELGEVLVAALLSTFQKVLRAGLCDVMPTLIEDGAAAPIELVAAETSRAAERLLAVCIQAIDYTPPVHMEFGDYLSALLTVHRDLYGPNPRVGLDRLLETSFTAFGIEPAANGGHLTRFRDQGHDVEPLDYSGVRHDQIQTDRDEAFRFVFANWKALGFNDESYVRVLSVRPSIRISPDDGFMVRETVIECLERLRLRRHELQEKLKIEQIGSGNDEDRLDLRGGVTLILGDDGQVKYTIHKHLIPTSSPQSRKAAADRVDYIEDLERSGSVTRSAHPADFAELHRLSDPVELSCDCEAWR